ncbi:Uncharacterised protein [Chlamydia abortus]|uniref:Uncharacterized protein n=1 Tax=Paenibacillus residui TaxID=629724 RepID=A0ABW3DDT2_9BACL|nr:hypothetical protein [Aneurinibacillus sp. XH2]SHE09701.1 Uncharacterised protein [Chlamydia abortus]
MGTIQVDRLVRLLIVALSFLTLLITLYTMTHPEPSANRNEHSKIIREKVV